MGKNVDYLVIGSGIAGLSFALKAAQYGKVLIVTKSNEDESNTKYAQGGVAVVVDKEEDSFEKHIDDTLIAGDGLCDVEVVKIVVEEGPSRIKEIIDYGTNFDKTNQGIFDLAKEGGHSESRVLHYKDITGFEIERVLLEQIHQNKNIEILTHYFAIDLITQHHLGEFVDRSSTDIKCFGIYALNHLTKEVEKIQSKITVMASGGAGHIYSITTNPT
ncbi:MAG: FAD-dependent oxidoreductase, partial [Sphingobacteriaceae bacterium]